ncbi:MAG: flippase-like domain-containing protein [Chitinispirillaceae bacterium]|nr:flippase-like domain-containing protein [Chitinispirillaceae bacterium]
MKIDKKKWGTAGRILAFAIAVIPIAWIFLRLDFRRLIDCVHQVAWWTVPALCAINILSMVLQAVRWWIILRPMAPELPFLRMLSYHLIGAFYSTVLPGSVSTDVVKTVLLSKKLDYAIAWGAIWLCRIFGFLALIILSLYGLLTIDRSFLPHGFWLAVVLSSILTAAALALSFSKRFTSPLRSLIDRISPRRLMTVMENIRQGIYRFRQQHRALVLLFLVSLAAQTFIIVANVTTLYGITGRLIVADLFAFVPIIELIANSGPTPGGMGVREALIAVLFGHLRVSNEHLGIFVFLTLSISVGLKLIGALPVFHGMLKHRRQEKTAAVPPRG